MKQLSDRVNGTLASLTTALALASSFGPQSATVAEEARQEPLRLKKEKAPVLSQSPDKLAEDAAKLLAQTKLKSDDTLAVVRVLPASHAVSRKLLDLRNTAPAANFSEQPTQRDFDRFRTVVNGGAVLCEVVSVLKPAVEGTSPAVGTVCWVAGAGAGTSVLSERGSHLRSSTNYLGQIETAEAICILGAGVPASRLAASDLGTVKVPEGFFSVSNRIGNKIDLSIYPVRTGNWEYAALSAEQPNLNVPRIDPKYFAGILGSPPTRKRP